MTTGTFQENFSKLRTFLIEHPEIKISKTRVSIPRSKRTDFYQLFDEARRSFVIEKYPELIKAAEPLAQSFTKNQHEVEHLLELEKTIIPDGVRRFTDNPADSLIRILWTLLFDLLKERADYASFEANALREVRQLYSSLYYQTYEDWLELSLLKLLKPKHLLTVNVPTITGSFGHAQGYVMHLDLKPVILPEESKELSLLRGFSMVSFTVPDFIVYSAELGKYVSVKAEPCKANWIAVDPNESREWILLDKNPDIFEPGYLLIYVDDNPLSLALVNDARRICQPDIVLEFRESKNWYSDIKMQKIKVHNNVLKPILGTFIASVEPVKEFLYSKPEENIHLLNVGSDDNQLRTIIDALKTLTIKATPKANR